MGLFSSFKKALTRAINPFDFSKEKFNPLGDGLTLQMAPIQMLMGELMPMPELPAPDNQPNRDQLYRSGVAVRRWIYGKARVSGVLVFAEDSGAGDAYRHLVIVLAGHACEAIPTVWIEDKLSSHADYSGKLWVYPHLGAADQVADPVLVAECASWTAAHRLRGLTYVHVKYTKSAFPQGITKVACLVQGKDDILDPRTASSGWSDNWALCTHDWMRSVMKATSSEIDIELVKAAADAADQLVVADAAGSSFEKRYTCNGAIDLKGSALDGLEALVRAGAGFNSFSGGVWRLFAGVYSAPTFDLAESDLDGGFSFALGGDKKNRINRVRGTFYDPAGEYVKGEYPEVSSSAYQTIDGEELVADLHLGLTNSASACQRLAKIMLERSRRGLQVSFPAKYTALPLQPLDRLRLSCARLGWVDRVMLVERFSGNITSGIKLDLLSDDPQIYDWAPGDIIERSYPPLTNLPNPLQVDPPTGLLLVESSSRNTEGALQTQLDVSWDASPSSLVDSYEVQWQWIGGGTWSSATTPADTRNYSITGLLAGRSYNVQVRAVNALPVRSSWLSGSTSVDGITAAPAPPTSLTATSRPEAIALGWTNVAAASSLLGVEIWASADNNRANASRIDRILGDKYLHPLDPASTRYYWIKAVDRAGLASAWHPVSSTAGVQGLSASAGASFAQISQMVGFYRNGFEDDEFGSWATNGNTLAQVATPFVGTYAGQFGSSTAAPGATGTTGGSYAKIPDTIAAQWMGKRVRVQCHAKQLTAAGFALALGWTATVNGGSGWNAFTPAASYSQHGFLIDIPANITGLYVGVHGDTSGAGNATLIDAVSVYLVPDTITAANVDQWVGAAVFGSAHIAELSAAKLEAGTAGVDVALQSTDGKVVLDMMGKSLRMTAASGDYVLMAPGSLQFVDASDSSKNFSWVGGVMTVPSAVIGNAQIDRATANKLIIVEADIGNLQVKTAKIADNAVTVPVSSSTVGGFYLSTHDVTATYDLNTTPTIAVAGIPYIINAEFELYDAYGGAYGDHTLIIKFNGAEIARTSTTPYRGPLFVLDSGGSAYATETTFFSKTFVHTPSTVGSYTLSCMRSSGRYTGARNRIISALGSTGK